MRTSFTSFYGVHFIFLFLQYVSATLIVPSCPANSVYISAARSCQNCTAFSLSSESISCTCRPGQQTNRPCQSCQSPQIPSSDGTFCMRCPNDTITTLSINGFSYSTCRCDSSQYVAERDANGTPLATAVCSSCPAGSYPSPDLSTCILCPNPMLMIAVLSNGRWACVCKTGYGFSSVPQGLECIDSNSLNSALRTGAVQTSISYPDGIDSSGFSVELGSYDSETIATRYLKALAKCDSQGDMMECETLANLCVLVMYDESHRVCASYLQLIRSRSLTYSDPFDDQARVLPWLYYGTINKEPAVLTALRIPPLQIGFRTGIAQLPLILGKTTLEGRFLGYVNVTDDMQLCEGDSSWKTFGRRYNSTCRINLLELLAKTNETFFYEPYVYDSRGSLYPVPVRVLNFRSNGQRPNAAASLIDFNGNRFFRRFMLVDVASGVQSQQLRVMRVASHIRIIITKVPGSGNIRIPIIDVKYTERVVTSLSYTDQSAYSYPKIDFEVAYRQDYIQFADTVIIILAILAILAVLYAFSLARAWNKRNLGPSDVFDLRFLVRFSLFLCGVIGPVVFCFIFLLSLYFLLFFKIQDSLFMMLPWNDGLTSLFLAGMFGAFGCTLIFVIREMSRQCNTDIFLFDWERSKGKVVVPGSEYQSEIAPVSVWRTIFMANHFSRIQLAILEGASFRYLAGTNPDFTMIPKTEKPDPILLFAIDSLVFLILCAIQGIIQTFFVRRFYRDPIVEFMDVLSLSNISLIILDEPCHGHYIHGRSVHACADTNLEVLNSFLRNEANDMAPRRGLEDTNQQTFELILTPSARKTINKIFTPKPSNDKDRTKLMKNRMDMWNLKGTTGKGYQSIQAAPDGHTKAYIQLTKFLRSFIDKNLKDYPYTIRQKNYFEKFLPTAPDVSLGCLFFSETTSYRKVLLEGMEIHLIVMYTLLFAVIDNLMNSSAGAAFSVWILDICIRIARQHFGDRNISKKTLLDWKFLL